MKTFFLRALNLSLLGGFLSLTSRGQTVAPDQTTMATMRQEQAALGQEWTALLASGATAQQMQAWQTKNASRIAANQQRAQQISAAFAAQPLPIITDVTIPAGVSKDTEDLLVTQATLANGAAQIHNANLPSASAGSTTTMTPQEAQAVSAYTAQNAAVMQAQVDRAKRVSGELTSTAQPVPGPLSLPANIGPEMKAFLILRDQLQREQVAVWNQNLTSDSDAMAAVLAKWSQQNSARLQQLQTLALAIPAAKPTTPTNP